MLLAQFVQLGEAFQLDGGQSLVFGSSVKLDQEQLLLTRAELLKFLQLKGSVAGLELYVKRQDDKHG